MGFTCVIKFAQVHETFRRAEIEALAIIENISLTILEYSDESPYCLVSLPSLQDAQKLIRRSILASSIHELWGLGKTLDDLHESIRSRSTHLWPDYKQSSFKFITDSYQGARTKDKRVAIINSFKYLGFEGPIIMSEPDQTFTIFELWPWNSVPTGVENPSFWYFGRLVGTGARNTILKYDLKKRDYISTTSMDAELSLVTANITLAAPGKLFYDPFVGTGSFPLACAHFGAFGWGSDIDGRSMRGGGGKNSIRGNFEQYRLLPFMSGLFSADLTNAPIRRHKRTWDGIVCDPPYGVREGLKVLGLKDPAGSPWLVEKGIKNAFDVDYIPPKKPYGFSAILEDILQFAADTLVDHGRLSFWMPTANDEQLELAVPEHPCLEIVVVCVQTFRKWSRRLITYRRLPDSDVSSVAMEAYEARERIQAIGTTADELNPFRRAYFTKFEIQPSA